MRSSKQLLAVPMIALMGLSLTACVSIDKDFYEPQNSSSAGSMYIGESEETERAVAWDTTIEAFLKESGVSMLEAEPGEPDSKDYSSYLGTKNGCNIQFLTLDIPVSEDGIPNTFKIYKNIVEQNEKTEQLPTVSVKTSAGDKVEMWGLEYSRQNLELKEGAMPGEDSFNPETDLVSSGAINSIEFFVADNTPKASPNAPEGTPAAEDSIPTASSASMKIECLDADPSEVIPDIVEQLESNPNIVIRLENTK